MRNQKELIRLRERKVSNGNSSLYLDIYFNGRRKYEYLRLYLVPEKTKADKAKNARTLQLAEAIKSKRLVDIQNGVYGFESDKSDTDFLDYLSEIIKEKEQTDSEGNVEIWRSVEAHIRNYCKKRITFAEITPSWVEGFKRYLNKATWIGKDGERLLSQSTKGTYFSKFLFIFHRAKKQKIIREDPTEDVEGFKKSESERVFLTKEEVLKLSKTCDNKDVLQRAFLFSCLTGLRKSDIQKLTWSMVSVVNGYTRITFRQIKTKGLQYLDISEHAVQYMGEKGKPSDKIFDGFKYDSLTNMRLKTWAYASGVQKPLTYHSSRHTFVVLLLSNGVDFYTVSKLVGHADIKTTMKYSHILDENAHKAIDSLHDLIETEKAEE